MGVQFILFLGIEIGIGVLLAQRSGIWQRTLAAPATLRYARYCWRARHRLP